mmetsp:Transcript_30077/g.82606  ORF Transcript_30077/g.82606 Transcript_30077/m.82606 type:complete len:273 (-) Transcript_30077:194-1012(-)
MTKFQTFSLATVAMMMGALVPPPTAQAFSPLASLPFSYRKRTTAVSDLHSTSSSSSDNEVQAALEATQVYGATSPEARVLWDAIEERRSADNSEAMKGGILDEECFLDENGISQACMEYHDKMSELIRLMNEYEDWRDLVAEQHMFDNFKSLTRDLSVLKLNVNSAKQQNNHVASPQEQTILAEAIQLAKRATEVYGIHSVEAKLQWETVEEIASAGLENAMGPATELYELLDEECLVEQASDACLALEELNQALNANQEAAAATNNGQQHF